MFIRSMGRKDTTNRFKRPHHIRRHVSRLAHYIGREAEQGQTITHRLRADGEDLAAIVDEFSSNARHLRPRRNGNVLYHDFISFDVRDRAKLAPAIVEDLMREYIELRAPKALVYGRVHQQTSALHVHLMISANAEKGSHRARLSKRSFEQVRTRLHAYMHEQYPELEVGRQEAREVQQVPVKETWREQKRRHRMAKERVNPTSHKERIRQAVAEAIIMAMSAEQCYHSLKESGYLLYKRGKSIGVEDLSSGKRYRLRTLKLDEEFAKARKQWRRVTQTIEQSKRERVDLQRTGILKDKTTRL